MKLTFSDARIELDGGTWRCMKMDETDSARRCVYGHKRRHYSGKFTAQL